MMDTQTATQIRAHVHEMWARVATGWGEIAEEIDQRGAAQTEWMLSVTTVGPGDRVLELACGPGGAGLTAAASVGSTGEVVLSDVVPEMVAIAASRARDRGLTNVRTATLDLEQIDVPDASFDVVLCREGLMFAVEPDRACSEMHRVLRRGGRLAVAVWASPNENPWLGVVMKALRATTGAHTPPPGAPGPFALADETRLCTLLADAGFVDVVIEHLPVPLRSPSFEAWWARTTSIAGPVAEIISRLDAPTRSALEDELRRAVAPYATTTGIELPGLTMLASARRG